MTIWAEIIRHGSGDMSLRIFAELPTPSRRQWTPQILHHIARANDATDESEARLREACAALCIEVRESRIELEERA